MMHTTFRMPARRLLSTALVSCLMLAAAPNVMAQSANASLRGQVAGAQAGTEVTATNVATGTVRRGTIRADGSYSLMGLDPGTYDVVANGASAVAFYRSYFTTNLRRHGPDVVLR